MATWILSPIYKKSAYETEYWVKNNVTIQVVTVWRWASVSIDSDTKPDIDLKNPSGLEIFSLDYYVTPLDYHDGDVHLEFPDDMEEEECDRIRELYDEEWGEGLENDGWSQDDVELIFYEELELKEEEEEEEEQEDTPE